MQAVKDFFVEFRSIFSGNDVLKENEEHANVVVATTMFNIFILTIIIYLLTLIGVFNVNKKLMLYSVIVNIFTLFIPALISFRIKGRGKYLKFILMVFLNGSIGVTYSFLTYTAILLLVVPILLAARYYSREFTVFVAFISALMMAAAEFAGIYIGLLDLNYVELPQGTVLTIDTNILDAVKQQELNMRDVERYFFLDSYLPKLFLYLGIITFACVQISQSGRNMIERQKKLSEESSRIESELNIAREIQKNMLPSTFPAFPEYREFDIYASMTPAKEVGGDFYDMFLIDEYHLAMVIADVSGKGVPAALIMMTARTLIKNTALNGYSVDEVFNRANAVLCEGNASYHFVTAWFGIMDLSSGKLEFANAGHNPALIYSKQENSFHYLRAKANLVLAAMENMRYRKHEVLLEPGDRVFLYTDGVTEATNAKEELYGEERLKEALDHSLELDAEATIRGVKKDIDAFVKEADPFDDITMLEFIFKEKKRING